MKVGNLEAATVEASLGYFIYGFNAWCRMAGGYMPGYPIPGGCLKD